MFLKPTGGAGCKVNLSPVILCPKLKYNAQDVGQYVRSVEVSGRYSGVLRLFTNLQMVLLELGNL